ncbi:MAG TPA: alpha/beta hydrolase [Caulobacteraceae bacterium]
MPHATAADGTKLWFEEAGAGPPLLLAHELGSDARQWRGQVGAFSGDFRCIAPNARGYPPSEVPEDADAYLWDRFADDIGAVLDAAGEARAALVGWSMGAYAALQFARLHPGRVRALVLVGIGSGSPKADETGWRTQMALMAAAWLEDPRRGADTMAEADNRQPLRRLNPGAFDAWLADLEGHSPEGMARTCRNYQGRRPSLQDFEAEFAGLEVPTLIVCGEEDAPCLEASRWLERTLPNAQLWLVAGAGHCPNLEIADKFNRRVGQFLADLSKAAA